MRKLQSIRSRLLLWLLLPLIGIAAFVASETYYSAQKNINQLYDKTLLAVMLTISENVLSSNGDLLSENLLEVLTENLGDQLFYHISGPDNSFVTGYSGYPKLPRMVKLKSGIPFFYDGMYQGDRVRVVALRRLETGRDLNGWITVTTWQTVFRRDQQSLALFLHSVFRLLLLVSSAGIIVWFAIIRGLKPLADLQHAIEQRSPQDLSAIQRFVPVEARNLVRSMNSLFDELRQTKRARERFIADAAHQLRNPVAALKTQAEAALDARNTHDRLLRIRTIVDTSNHTSRLIHQLLTAAKVNTGQGTHETFDLVKAVSDAGREFAPQVFSRGSEIIFTGENLQLQLLGNPLLIHEAIVNLLDNAIRHNPAPVHITLGITTVDDAVELFVEDDGNPFPDNFLKESFQPFVSGSTESAANGLGLSIVQDIARQHGGSFSITADQGRGTKKCVIRLPYNTHYPFS